MNFVLRSVIISKSGTGIKHLKTELKWKWQKNQAKENIIEEQDDRDMFR